MAYYIIQWSSFSSKDYHMNEKANELCTCKWDFKGS